MKTRVPLVVLVLLGVVGIALVTTLGAQAPKGLIGTWKLDVAKSKFSPGPAPKSMTATYSAAGDTMKIVVDIVPAEGAAQHWEMSAAYDGKEYPVTGNPNADVIALKKIDDTHGESTFKKGGKVTSVNSRTLSADGKTLTIVSKGTTVDGKPRLDTQVFSK
jgi:hypothetical protein